MVIVEPARFALTSTPSIAPSSCEVTLPVNADTVWALARPVSAKLAKSAPRRAVERIPRIWLIILDSPSSLPLLCPIFRNDHVDQRQNRPFGRGEQPKATCA